MIKLISFIVTIVYLGISDILEFLKNLHHTGPTWGAVITALFLWSKLKKNKRWQEHNERLESKVDAIIKHLGVEGEWSAEESSCGKNTEKTLSRLSQRAIYLVRSVMLSIHRKVIGLLHLRGKMQMQLSKSWLVGLIGYVAYFIKVSTGFEIPDEMIDKIADLVLMLTVIISMIINMRKSKESKKQNPKENDLPYDGAKMN